jgi:hypothetical protein
MCASKIVLDKASWGGVEHPSKEKKWKEKELLLDPKGLGYFACEIHVTWTLGNTNRITSILTPT